MSLILLSFLWFKLNNLKAVLFNFFWWPKSLTLGFNNVGGNNFNFSSGIFFFVFVPFFQNQTVAFLNFKISKAQFQLFLSRNDLLKILTPNFFVDCCHNLLFCNCNNLPDYEFVRFNIFSLEIKPH